MSETPLDSLYGKGASSAVRKATGGSIDEVTLDAVGGVRVYVVTTSPPRARATCSGKSRMSIGLVM